MNDIEVSIAEVGENTAKIVGIEPYYYGTVNVTFDVGQYDICDWVDQNVDNKTIVFDTEHFNDFPEKILSYTGVDFVIIIIGGFNESSGLIYCIYLDNGIYFIGSIMIAVELTPIYTNFFDGEWISNSLYLDLFGSASDGEFYFLEPDLPFSSFAGCGLRGFAFIQ